MEFLAVDELEFALQAHLAVAKLSDLQLASPSTTKGAASKAEKKKKAEKKTPAEDQQEAPKVEYDRWNLKDESTLDYGYLAKTNGEGIATASDDADSSFYITTAINYTNGAAHMGHAYEAVTSDVIARYNRLLGERPTYFGTYACCVPSIGCHAAAAWINSAHFQPCHSI